MQNNANIESMLSAIITATGGTLRVLNALSASQQQLNGDMQQMKQDMKSQQHMTQLVTDSLTYTQKVLEDTNVIKSSIAMLVEAITEATSGEDITTVKSEIIDHLKHLDTQIKENNHSKVLELLIESLQEMQSNFETETQSIRQLHSGMTELQKVSELMSSRIDSMDIRTADLYNHQLTQGIPDIPLDIQHQIEENNRLLASMPQKKFNTET